MDATWHLQLLPAEAVGDGGSEKASLRPLRHCPEFRPGLHASQPTATCREQGSLQGPSAVMGEPWWVPVGMGDYGLRIPQTNHTVLRSWAPSSPLTNEESSPSHETSWGEP